MSETEITILLTSDTPKPERDAFIDALADFVHSYEPRTAWDPHMVATLNPDGTA